jgi:retron-type reverse transcriptase
MKRYGMLYEKIYDFNNLLEAFKKARKGKRYRNEVLQYAANLEENLINLQNQLIWQTYEPSRCNEFIVHEPKKRIISAPQFKDRVLHHAIYKIINPIFERIFIYDSYACRVGKGTHAGADRLTRFIRMHDSHAYCLKGDISKYFAGIDHETLKMILRKKIKCTKTLWLLDKIIDFNGEPTGLGLGALTSQLFANIYLNELDYYIKQVLLVRHYIRYMDDFIIVSDSKEEMHMIRGDIENFLWTHLKLKTNQKTQIFPISQGINFLGYRIWPNHRLIRKSSIKRIKRKLKRFSNDYRDGLISISQIYPILVSWLGHISHADSYGIRKKVLEKFRLRRV